jgi:putative solute:sodium symporter small subunit
MFNEEKVIDINFFKPKHKHIKAEAKSAAIIIILWAILWLSVPVLIKLTGDAKGIGPLTQSKLFGFPLHYWLVAQGVTVGFILLCILFIFIRSYNMKKHTK